ncbi:FHA domain-containing protein [Amycolatopsis tolypomycina]|uniref:FHA domain-containing protein n=1 Tax=Amycolatopsis tolypomycina TaxID=208445 RepID=A0A1H4WI28_9PSEU|nr:FHA domain-containing protein [Amycolatopsis tolypomycina]SEC92204.1 FHA domain-containing protein [Amycolatopsis tolypomycina]
MGGARIETLGGSGVRLEVRRGSWLVGRGPDADLRLRSEQVSLRHAWIRQDARGTWVADAGSRNGTWVNGRRLAPRQDHPLRDGDRLEFGPVSAVYADGSGAAHTRTWQRSPSGGVSFGDVSAGTINNAGRDVNNSYDHRQQHNYEFSTPEGQMISELATGRGAGRAVMVLGLLTILAGFGIWASVIFRFIKAGSDAVSSGSFDAPPPLLGPEVFDGVPLGVVGFALFGLGGVVLLIGLVMAKAARERRRNGRR